ncbi:MAG: adenylosuccinate lyase [Bacteroidetes bacterium]|nr:adenylosuccinate lyase [Bacteroidota bacterium]MBU1115198.1 adenylosuccinate lyase [Bacteroidota bacterium]MBU1799290.1 adenylosuccinate lyase [Bacteroidota bacterium]
MDKITNVLAERYASEEMKNIWSPEGRILLERELWIAVMKAQKELGLNIPAEAIKSYESVKANINLESIDARERISRHDVKARIEEFCELAGYEHIHKGMTSRDLTENVEQLQVYRGLYLLMGKSVAALSRIAEKAEKYSNLIIAARTHNVAAQPTTLGRRLAMFGEELLFGVNQLQFLIDNYPVRGLKGAVGTQVDQLTLFNNNSTKVKELEQKLLNHLGIKKSLNTVGQVYPRIIDFSVISTLFTLGSGLSSFATTLRIMAGNETVSEGFAKGQTGSSAMPHKMNSRSSERINGFQNILAGYVTMASSISGNQWNEGDVSCSVVRRVALPDSFYAIDGMLETFLTIIEQMEVFEPVIEKENKYYFPFLSTTTFLMEAVKKGTPREEAHEVIKEHSVATVRDLRNGIIVKNNLLERLANDLRLGLSLTELQSIMDKSEKLIGNAKLQIIDFVEQVDSYKYKYPKAEDYKPGSIL